MENVLILPRRGDIVREFLTRFGKNTQRCYNYPIIEFFERYFKVNQTHLITGEVIQLVTLDQVEHYFKKIIIEEKMERSAVDKRKTALSSFFNYIISRYQNSIISINHFNNPIITDFINLKLAKQPIEPIGDILTIDELEKLLLIVKKKKSFARDYLLMRMLMRGLRRDEASKIQFCDIKLIGEEWFLEIPSNITKTKKDRSIFLPDDFVEELKEWFFEARLGITKRRIFDISGSQINRIVKKCTSEIFPEKHITAHKIRHSIATYLAQDGTDIFEIMRIMGWASMETAQRYIHQVDKYKNNAGRRLSRV